MFWLSVALCSVASLVMRPAPGAEVRPATTAATMTMTSPVIRQEGTPAVWTIETAASQYRFGLASDDAPVPLYYGPKGQVAVPPAQAKRLKVPPKVGSKVREVPVRGGFAEQTPAIEVVYRDGTGDAHLVYDATGVTEVDGRPCLQLDLKDPAYPLRVTAFYRVLPELDVIQRWVVLRNDGDEPLTIENAQSASFHLPAGEYDMVHLAGTWGREFVPYTTRLTPGVKTLEVRDFVAFENPPWLAIRPAGEAGRADGGVWFAALHYSGNWRLDVRKDPAGEVQVVGGINFWDTAVRLAPKETFTTPKMVIGFAPDGMDGATRRMHDYVRWHVLPAKFRDRPRPVLYNSWYATTFDVREDQQIELAKAAKEMGVELFVIDDGWFKGRDNDKAGLGDWVVDRKKFPDGLGPMIKQINDLGMDFGIWVEPEMVNPDSDLYRAHPDWVVHYPNRTRHEQRNQLTLNLAREDVYQYLLESMTRLLSENNIRFIKWDRNRGLSDPGWPGAAPEERRAVRVRYMQNLYRLVDELRAKFPDVMFETCSGGGGRPDLGMLDRMDQVWTSDNTNPTDRLHIQFGYLNMLPANTMVSWVTDDNWHRAAVSTRYRFHAAMFGVLGVGGNIAKWGEADRKTAAEMVALYKEIRPVVQFGTAYPLLSPQDGERVAIQFVAAPRSDVAGSGAATTADARPGESVLFLFTMREEMAGGTASERGGRAVRLRGLVPDAEYEVTGEWKGRLTGRALMDVGIPWFLTGDYSSAVLRLRPAPVAGR